MAKKKHKNPIDDISELKTEAQEKSEIAHLKKTKAAYEKIIEQQQQRIDRLSKQKFEIPTQGSSRVKSDKRGHIRVIVPDTHGCFIDPRAADAFLNDLEALSPEEIIMIGDHIDCGGFLAQHQTLGYVAEADYTFDQDVFAANEFLDRLQSLAPKATIHYLEGNHERRIEKWCVTQSLRNSRDAEFLKAHLGTQAVLHLERRGINFYAQGVKYEGCKIPATIKLGKCYFTHGSKHGKRAADEMLKRFNAPIVFGHVHKLLEASDRNVKDGEVSAWCVGSLCRQQPLWKHSDPTDWTQGYGVQLVRPTGEFLHINVPIIDGQSYLIQFTEKASPKTKRRPSNKSRSSKK